jgi:hypothetical protein
MKTISSFRQKLIKQGAFRYVIALANGTYDFWKTKKEVSRALKKIPSYFHPRIYSTKGKGERFLVLDMSGNMGAIRTNDLPSVQFLMNENHMVYSE